MGDEMRGAGGAASAAVGSPYDQRGVRGLVEPQDHSMGYGLLGPDEEGGGSEPEEVANQLIPKQPDSKQSKPYAKATLDKVGELAPHIKAYAEKYGVPSLAVAGAIANEYDTRSNPAKAAYDRFQDWYVPRLSNVVGLPSANLDSGIVPTYAGSPGWMENDIGPVNIHLATAVKMWHENPGDLPVSVRDYPSLAQYVVSDQGTAQMTAKYISEAQRHFENSLPNTENPLSPDDKTALYVDYFRKGPEKLQQQWTERLTKDHGAAVTQVLQSGKVPLRTEDLPSPYDGVRVIANKRALHKALGQHR